MATATSAVPQWRKRRRRRRFISKSIAYLFTTLLAILFAVPFIYMLSMSLQNPLQLTSYPPTWWPRPFMWSNYPKALSYPQRPFHLFFRNSLWYTFAATLGTTVSSALVAFGFSRVEWPWRDKLFVLVLATMMLPAQVTMIPQYIIFKELGWLNSFKVFIVPAWLASAFNVFLLRQFFMTIPKELDEAAILDGCDYFTILWRIIVPLSKPALITVVAFSIVATWNNFMGPLLYLTDTKKFTVALGLYLLRSYAGDTGAMMEFGVVMAASVMSLLPMLILFVAAQRYFVTGIAMTGLKEG
jgi:multiple sugar transport system permease protein